MAIKEYRRIGTVQAEQVEESGQVSLSNGPGWANKGDYLVYENGTVSVVSADNFESRFEEVKGDSEFHPAGKTVEAVVEYMKEFPDQIRRIQDEESKGAERKGIMEYEKR